MSYAEERVNFAPSQKMKAKARHSPESSPEVSRRARVCVRERVYVHNAIKPGARHHAVFKSLAPSS